MSTGRVRAGAGVALVALLAAAAAWTWWPRAPRRPAPRALPEGAFVVPRDPAHAVARRFDPAGDPLGWIFEPGVPGRVIAGHVLNSDGMPGAGAVVQATPLVLRDAEPCAVARADADGHFDLGELPAGDWKVVVQHGDDSATVRVETSDPRAAPPADALMIRLEPCDGFVTGVVVDADARPIAGAEVETAKGRTTTGLDGRFRVCERWTITVAHAAFASQEVRNLERGADLVVVLWPHAVIEGRVRDAQGQPVTGAIVTTAGQTVVSDDAGGFAISVRPGSNAVKATWRGREDLAVVNLPPGGQGFVDLVLRTRCRRIGGHVVRSGLPVAGALILGTRSQADGSFVRDCASVLEIPVEVMGRRLVAPVWIPDGEAAIDDLRLELAPAASLTGSVTLGGKGVAGARVVWKGDTVAVTDDTGRFEAKDVEPGLGVLTARESRSNSSVLGATVELREGKRHEAHLQLLGEVAIRGRVLDPRGQPRAAAYVRLMVAGKPVGRPVESDKDGRYVLRTSHRGAAALAIEEHPHPVVIGDDGADAGDVVVPALTERERERDAMHPVEGVVVDESGTPVAGVFVGDLRDGQLTGSDGRFTIEDSPKMVSALAPDGRSVTQWVERSATPVRLVLRRRSAATIDWSGGSGPFLVFVDCRRGGHWRRTVLERGVVVPELPGEDCTVSVRDDTLVGEARLPAGAHPKVSVVLEPRGEIIGTVLFPGTVPEEPVECSVGSIGTTMRPDGVYRLRALEPGPAVVHCRTWPWRHDEGEPSWSGEAEVDVRRGENRLDVYMAPDLDEVDESEPPDPADDPE